MHCVFNRIALGIRDIGLQILCGLDIVDGAGHCMEDAGGHSDILEHAAEVVYAHLVPVALVDRPLLRLKIGEHGAGEAGDEILYGRKALQRDIAAATAANNGVTINVYGGNQTAEEIAEAVERKLIQMQKRTRAAWA